jgi:2-oxoisovalerate dehydrogenase E1 component alpha subunit
VGGTKVAERGLDRDLLLRMHRNMVRARLLEERLIRMNKVGQGFFWIGGPGEEAFNTALGMQVKKGRGLDFDYLHLHYRSGAVLLALGAPPLDTLRQMRTAASDPYSKGRYFVNHPAIPAWNVMPVAATIETQYSTAVGTGIAQARHGGDGITIVTGGDGGTAEPDFHTCLVWSNRPALPLPVLMIVVNNGWAISTPAREQHGEKRISDWAKAFDMPGRTIDGNDAAESYAAVGEAMAYCRRTRRPYLLEARTSRLYGHSSSSGAGRVTEPDCIALLEKKLIEAEPGLGGGLKDVWKEEAEALERAHAKALAEPTPAAETIWDDVFAGAVPGDYPKKGGS